MAALHPVAIKNFQIFRHEIGALLRVNRIDRGPQCPPLCPTNFRYLLAIIFLHHHRSGFPPNWPRSLKHPMTTRARFCFPPRGGSPSPFPPLNGMYAGGYHQCLSNTLPPWISHLGKVFVSMDMF